MYEYNIEQLAAQFGKTTTINIINTSPYYLKYNDEEQKVISNEWIYEGSRIGIIPGEPKYIWEISHSEYMFVNDEYIMDVSNLYPRPLITYIRNENESWTRANCIIKLENDNEGNPIVAMYTIDKIYPNDELVYTVENCRYY